VFQSSGEPKVFNQRARKQGQRIIQPRPHPTTMEALLRVTDALKSFRVRFRFAFPLFLTPVHLYRRQDSPSYDLQSNFLTTTEYPAPPTSIRQLRYELCFQVNFIIQLLLREYPTTRAISLVGNSWQLHIRDAHVIS
jgi:hypothetical protein